MDIFLLNCDICKNVEFIDLGKVLPKSNKLVGKIQKTISELARSHIILVKVKNVKMGILTYINKKSIASVF